MCPQKDTAHSYRTQPSCRVCSNIIRDRNRSAEAIWDKKLHETESFVSVPSVGALVEGYVLTIPKAHKICSGALNSDSLSRFWSFTQQVKRAIEDEFGQSILFEHGPCREETVVGCGVDHAHIHIVPIDGPIREIAADLNPTPISWESIDSIHALEEIYQGGNEYLLYADGDGSLTVGCAEEIRSQLFRRAIADVTGKQEKFDWNDHTFEGNVRSTIRRLENSRLELTA